LKEYLRNYLSPQKNKNKQYQKFLIYGLPRTGSNLICGILEKHKAISCHGEVFNAGRIFCNLKNSQGDAILKIFRQYNPLYFLKLAIWHNDYSESVKAVGFKALYNQLENFVYLKEYIFGLEDLKIIFLRRKNYLERIYSELLALQNNQWTLQNEEERDQRKLNIPFEKCKFLFEKEENFYINTLKILEAKNLPYLEIYYEDLNKNLRNEINKITRYSNLEDCNNLDTNLKKQNIKKLSEVIENYQDLKQSFANTKWELFFEE
jgi:LPS sulfotransferase NodH